MNSLIVYTKENQEVFVSDNFIYRSSVYRIWKQGVCLIDDRYYTSKTPLNVNKVPTILKKKEYNVHRFIELEGAPEEYLIKNGYKIKKHETGQSNL